LLTTETTCNGAIDPQHFCSLKSSGGRSDCRHLCRTIPCAHPLGADPMLPPDAESHSRRPGQEGLPEGVPAAPGEGGPRLHEVRRVLIGTEEQEVRRRAVYPRRLPPGGPRRWVSSPRPPRQRNHQAPTWGVGVECGQQCTDCNLRAKCRQKATFRKMNCLEGKCRFQTRLPPPRCLFFLVLFHYDVPHDLIYVRRNWPRGPSVQIPRGFLSINLGHRIPCFSVPVKPPRDQQRPGKLSSSQARGTFVGLADRGLVEFNIF